MHSEIVSLTNGLNGGDTDNRRGALQGSRVAVLPPSSGQVNEMLCMLWALRATNYSYI